jgi:glucose/arabinose dehydrogenase
MRGDRGQAAVRGPGWRRAALAVGAGALSSACGASTGLTPGASPPPPAASPPAAQPGQPRVLASGLAVPWAIPFLPGGAALVTERDTARLLRVTPQGQVAVAGTIPGVAPGGEGGLLGVAVPPSFRQDRLVYVYFSTAGDNRIARFRYAGGRIGPLHTLVTGIPHAAIHNGGRLAFGPDGMLYAGTGEHGESALLRTRPRWAARSCG